MPKKKLNVQINSHNTKNKLPKCQTNINLPLKIFCFPINFCGQPLFFTYHKQHQSWNVHVLMISWYIRFWLPVQKRLEIFCTASEQQSKNNISKVEEFMVQSPFLKKLFQYLSFINFFLSSCGSTSARGEIRR